MSLTLFFLFFRRIPLEKLGLVKIGFKKNITFVFLGTLIGFLIFKYTYTMVSKYVLTYGLSSYPDLHHLYYRYLDLTFRLLLVAFLEELMFRGVFSYYLEERLPLFFNILFCSLLFSFSYWSFGLPAIIATFLWGVLLHIIRSKSKSLYPSIVVHYFSSLYLLWEFYF